MNKENSDNKNSFNIYSWNVLHIYHELKYSKDTSLILEKYDIVKNLDNEKNRLNDIYQMILSFMHESNCFICLQEVPGDIIKILKNDLDKNNYSIFYHTYPRIPQNTTNQPNPYNDSCENLVILCPKTENRNYQHNIIEFDKGKACQILSFDSTCIINIHCPFDKQSKIALSNLKKYLCNNFPSDQHIIMSGDMNKNYNQLIKEYNELNIKMAVIKTDNYTRKWRENETTINTSSIDFFSVTSGIKVILTKSFIENDISDHYPIKMEFVYRIK